MIPLFRHLIDKVLHDEAAVRRWGRAALMGIAGGGIAFADQLAAALDMPDYIKAIKACAVVAGFLSLMISIGEKNAKDEPAGGQPT